MRRLNVRAWAVLRRDARSDVVWRHVFGDDGIGAYGGAGAYRDGAEDLRAGANGDVIADGGVALGLGEDLAAQGHAVVEHDAVADLRGLADDDAHAVVDEETAADGGTRVDLHAGEEAVDLRENARRASPASLPHPVADAVAPDGMEAGIHDGILYVAARGGVMISGVGEILADSGKNAHGHPL